MAAQSFLTISCTLSWTCLLRPEIQTRQDLGSGAVRCRFESYPGNIPGHFSNKEVRPIQTPMQSHTCRAFLSLTQSSEIQIQHCLFFIYFQELKIS